MATPCSDDGVPVDLENGGGLSSAVPCGGRNADKDTSKAKKKKPAKGKKKSAKGNKEQGSSDSHTGLALMMLALYYFYLVFYMVAFSEKWWHAVLGIAVASVFSEKWWHALDEP